MKNISLRRPPSAALFSRIAVFSRAAALLVWALFFLLAVFIILGYRDRARLIRDNENERFLNTLFASIRNYDDFGSAIEASDILKERIAGVAVYSADLAPLYRWGRTPDRFDPSLMEEPAQRFNRRIITDRRRRSVILVIHADRPPPGEYQNPERRRTTEADEDREPGRQRPRQWPWIFSAFSGGNYLYIDINHNAYWNTMYLTAALYPVSAAALLFLTLVIRRLYLRNIEYRRRIEAQQNLVVMGTAASTLAHEIRNPLHSIKLQTGILKKTITGNAEEIARIEEEVDRLSGLTYRINDYLRDPRGSPEPVNPAEIIRDISIRLSGRSIIGGEASPLAPTSKAVLRCPPLLAYMDGERARSLFENIIRNALESGGPPEALTADITEEAGSIIITIKDRGRGIAPEDLARVFDPFYTSKSTGTGIGLAISRRFVDAAGGSIVLANRNKGGAAVTVTLPAAP